MIRFAIAMTFALVATAAHAGTEKYEFAKECNFRSPILGDFKVALFKETSYYRDRAILIKSSAAPAPMLIDDVTKEFKTEGHTTLKKAVFNYGVGGMSTVKFYENPQFPQWARLKIYFRPAHGGCHEGYCGGYSAERIEIVETTDCVGISSF